MLDAAESVVYVALAGLLFAFIASGIAISSEAFLKASGRDVSEEFDAVVKLIERGFTPLTIVFLALSSLLGIYKQSQLSSGATSYENLKDGDRRR